MVLHVVIAQAQLERVPADIAGHPAVRKHAQSMGKKGSELLLDQNYHRQAMGKMEDKENRGRPDLVQNSLLNLLESPLSKAGKVRVWIQTRNNEFIAVRGDTRLPRGEARFQGVMAKLLRDGKSQDTDPLLWVEGSKNAAQIVEKFAGTPIIRLCETGKRGTPMQLAELARNGELVVILGGFPHGEWSQEWQQAAPNTFSIWDEPLNAWNVAAEVASGFRFKHGPF